jgi:hypothetical protein
MRVPEARWFRKSKTGHIFLFPIAWQGWAAFAAFVVLIAASSRLDGSLGWWVRIGVFGGYLGLSYMTCRED